MDTSISIIFFLAAILIFAAILFAVISLTKRGAQHLDVDKYRTRWMAIEQQLKREEQSSYLMSILNADSLLDQALKEKGIHGQTLITSGVHTNFEIALRMNQMSDSAMRTQGERSWPSSRRSKT
jgi:hypothetical protein